MSLPRLSHRTIEIIKEKVDIVDVISQYVVLKKKGREFLGICPFHDDTSPSLTVAPGKQLYHCFSCGAGGDAIKFLMEIKRDSFSEIVLELAKKYQLPIETANGARQEKLRQQLSRYEQLHSTLALASNWFQDQLHTEVGAEALTYLKEVRSLSQDTIKRFELGYAPESWDSLFRYLSNKKNISSNILESAGLIISRKGKHGFYDRFRHRVIIPIHNRQGRIIGFGGRRLDGGEPKYLNSPETEVFQKGKHLFGLHLASHSIRKENKAIVVEGYFDVISLHVLGITNVVASLGTSLSSYQISQISHWSEDKRIVLNFDTDSAGIRAVQRAISALEEFILEGRIELRILQLWGAKDPDDFVKKHSANDYLSLLNKAPLWLDWQIDQILKDKDTSKTEYFAQAVSSLVVLLGKLPQSAIRSHYIQQVAERLSNGQVRLKLRLEEDLLHQIKGETKPQYQYQQQDKFQYINESGSQKKAEAEILRLYIYLPDYRTTIREELERMGWTRFTVQSYCLVWNTIKEIEFKKLGTIYPTNSTEQLGAINLLQLLSDQISSLEVIPKHDLDNLMKPSEVNLITFEEPILLLRGAVAILDRQKSIMRCRHLLEAWSHQRLETLERCIDILIKQEIRQPPGPLNMEDKIESIFLKLNADAIRFQELYYQERKYIHLLDNQRCTGLSADISHF
uniref:DNA primase n=1 Tax=Paulinella chromatophora TaxID=39717 RepID=B1X418_PAUCH|nr:DNA primase [Paulinella chromatophora]ACB42687.1 DNA primase [Paulinella chromatophora]